MLGSTIALADSSGAIQTQYSYGPFGNVTVSGASSANPYQFTGRENDGTGLYFYRARHYSPTLDRFVSEDPAPRAGNRPVSFLRTQALASQRLNPYVYALDDPILFFDPFGLYSCQGRWLVVHDTFTGGPIGEPRTGSATSCTCIWGCQACDGSMDLYSIPPQTPGYPIETSSGVICLCEYPGPQTGCPSCPINK